METREILLGMRAMNLLSTAQLAVLMQHVRLHAAALRALAAMREAQWLSELTSQGVAVAEWSPEERTALKVLTNRFLREWARRGPPGARGGPSPRVGIVNSIEQFQRARGLI
jgi:hypothetical protein